MPVASTHSDFFVQHDLTIALARSMKEGQSLSSADKQDSGRRDGRMEGREEEERWATALHSNAYAVRIFLLLERIATC